MFDYVKSRPTKVGEKLRTQHFHPGTVGFAAPEDANTAVRVPPGTELAFATAIKCSPARARAEWELGTLATDPEQPAGVFRRFPLGSSVLDALWIVAIILEQPAYALIIPSRLIRFGLLILLLQVLPRIKIQTDFI
jgi:hypothetical protein